MGCSTSSHPTKRFIEVLASSYISRNGCEHPFKCNRVPCLVTIGVTELWALEWQGHVSNYKDEKDAAPLQDVKRGSGRCSDDAHCGFGTCVLKKCKCDKDHTGPHCLVGLCRNEHSSGVKFYVRVQLRTPFSAPWIRPCSVMFWSCCTNRLSYRSSFTLDVWIKIPFSFSNEHVTHYLTQSLEYSTAAACLQLFGMALDSVLNNLFEILT